MYVHQILRPKRRSQFRGEIGASREERIVCAERIALPLPLSPLYTSAGNRGRGWKRAWLKVDPVSVETLQAAIESFPNDPALIVSFPVVIPVSSYVGGTLLCRRYGVLIRGTAIVRGVFCRKSNVIEIGHTSRENRHGNREIAAPRGLPGIGRIFEESRIVILDWLQREHVPAEMRGLRDPAASVKAEL